MLDIYSEGTEGDADYMRMVQDVSMQPHANIENSTGRMICHRRLPLLKLTQMFEIRCRLKMHSKARLDGCLAEEVSILP